MCRVKGKCNFPFTAFQQSINDFLMLNTTYEVRQKSKQLVAPKLFAIFLLIVYSHWKRMIRNIVYLKHIRAEESLQSI